MIDQAMRAPRCVASVRLIRAVPSGLSERVPWPSAAESGLGAITGCLWSAPYEDLKVKAK